MIIRKKISNHPTITSIQRFVIVYGHTLNTRTKTLEFDYEVQYMNGTTDVTNALRQPLRKWVVDNSYKVFRRDALNNRIPNPNYEPHYPVIDALNNIVSDTPDNVDDQWLRSPAFDYFYEELHVNQGLTLTELLDANIPLNDSVLKYYDAENI